MRRNGRSVISVPTATAGYDQLQLAESVYHLQDDEAVGILKNLQELVGETSEVYYYQNTRIKGSSLRTALNLYGMAINKFLGNSLIKRLEGTDFRSMEEVWSQLKPTSSAGRGEWLDLSGLILPREELDGLIEKVEEGKITCLSG